MKIDLHTHTNHSDGKLSPDELLDRAIKRRIKLLSITDHDTVTAYKNLSGSKTAQLKVIPGIEFSTTWQGIGIHIVGLNLNLDDPGLQKGVDFQTGARHERAIKIAERLEKKLDIENPLAAVTELSNRKHIGRPHFAQHLVNIGVVSQIDIAFKKYLGPGKIGDIKETWASLEQVTEWITNADGAAVIAHPLKYKLTRTKLIRLIDTFKGAGGTAMEVVNGRQKRDDTERLAAHCESKGLLASCGSDFHDPEFNWTEVGDMTDLPERCQPVWTDWSITEID